MMAAADSIPGRAPAFQFYPKDFLHDQNVIVMTLQERGAYITLLCLCWSNPLPSDPSRLAKLCGVPPSTFSRIWPALKICFRPHPGDDSLLIHPRLEREREKQADYRAKQAENGKKGGRPSKGLGFSGLTQTEPTANPRDSQTKAKESSASSSLSASSSASSPAGEEDTLARRAGNFVEWYADKHHEVFNVGYIGNPQKDYETAMRLCAKFTDDDLQDAVFVWFGMEDDFAKKGTRTVPKFASRIVECVQEARKVPA